MELNSQSVAAKGASLVGWLEAFSGKTSAKTVQCIHGLRKPLQRKLSNIS
jgi:hypothetical protein